jgi:hypothetical protein
VIRKCRRERTLSATSILNRPFSPSDGADALDSQGALDAPDAVDFRFNGWR